MDQPTTSDHTAGAHGFGHPGASIAPGYGGSTLSAPSSIAKNPAPMGEVPAALSESENVTAILLEELNGLSVQLMPVMNIVGGDAAKRPSTPRTTVISQRIGDNTDKLLMAIDAVRTMRASLHV